MDSRMIASCGAYCGACDWREKTDCPGCQEAKGRMFWGKCAVATCALAKGLLHCVEMYASGSVAIRMVFICDRNGRFTPQHL